MDYDAALQLVNWCIDRGYVARMQFRDGTYFCEYATAANKKWQRY